MRDFSVMLCPATPPAIIFPHSAGRHQHGTPATAMGRIEAEHFDIGANRAAYFVPVSQAATRGPDVSVHTAAEFGRRGNLHLTGIGIK